MVRSDKFTLTISHLWSYSLKALGTLHFLISALCCADPVPNENILLFSFVEETGLVLLLHCVTQ